jgi:hypothetical protein
MKLVSSAALGTALVLTATAQYSQPSPAPSSAPAAAPSGAAKTLAVKLNPQNNSGEGGTATLSDSPNGLLVRVKLSGEPEGVPQPMHIHKGTCATLDPKPAYPLKSVENGSSDSTVPNVTIAELEKGKYAINVHKSTSEITTYVACGNIVASK